MVRLKKTFYIIAFTFLGIILSFLIHAGVEILVIGLIVENGEIRGLSWQSWKIIHDTGSMALLVAGIVIGVWQGFYWWPKLYDKSGRKIKKNKNLK